MANDAGQEISFTRTEWVLSCPQPHQKAFSTCSFTEPGLLDETIELVKEKVWSFRSAWKGVAEVFCRIGVSPTVLGYSYPPSVYFSHIIIHVLNVVRSVPIHEDDYVKEHDKDRLALAKVDADNGKVSREPCAHFLRRSFSGSSIPEEDNLLLTEDEHEDDVDHGFAESARKDLVERKSLTGSAR